MEVFNIPTHYGRHQQPFPFYIGKEPSDAFNPLYFQSTWLKTYRNGELSAEVLESMAKLYEIYQKNNVRDYAELVIYAMKSAKNELSDVGELDPKALAQKTKNNKPPREKKPVSPISCSRIFTASSVVLEEATEDRLIDEVVEYILQRANTASDATHLLLPFILNLPAQKLKKIYNELKATPIEYENCAYYLAVDADVLGKHFRRTVLEGLSYILINQELLKTACDELAAMIRKMPDAPSLFHTCTETLKKEMQKNPTLSSQQIRSLLLETAKENISDMESETNTTDDLELYKQANDLRRKGMYKNALPLYEKLAERGHPKSLYWLGIIYELGHGVKKNNLLAAKKFKASADKGDKHAKGRYARMLIEGRGVQQDVTYGLQLAHEAYEENDGGYAAHAIGAFYHGKFRQQNGQEKNYVKAREWYEKALEQNSTRSTSLYELAQLHEKGLGTEKSPSFAHSYYERADIAGCKKSAARLAAIKKKEESVFFPQLLNTDHDATVMTEKLRTSRTLSISLLLVGPSGTGKYSFAKNIAEKLKLDITTRNVAELVNTSDIRAAFTAATESKSMLILEDVTSLFCKGGISWGDRNVDSMSATLVKAMRDFPYPLICIIKDGVELQHDLKDEFLFRLEFEYLTRDQSKLAFKEFFGLQAPKALSAIGALTPQDFKTVKKRLFVLGEENNKDAILEHLKAISQERSQAVIDELNTDDFNLELINADVDLMAHTEKLINMGGESAYSILIYGPPGTGKSEYLRYLGQKSGIEVILKRASELINKFIGESEKAIASAFKEAEKRKSLLVFDEVEGLLGDREIMDKSWDISRVNEMLTWMESHAYPFAATTNYLDKIDRAALRRFVFKIKFDYLTKEQAHKAFRHFFQQPSPKELDAIGGLTIGDFATVKKYAKIFGELHNPQALVKYLKQETKSKSRSDIQHLEQANVTFNMALANPDSDLQHIEDRILAPQASKQFSFLLYGPSGTGKSLYLRHLAAKLGMEVIVKRSSDILSKWIGETEQGIAAAFKEAKERKAFLVLDEADSLLADRSRMQHNWQVQQVNEMLTWMETHAYPFACTTNLLEGMDKAAMRRFLFRIKFDFLSSEQIRSAFQYFFGIDAPDEISQFRKLTPAIFASAKRKAEVFGLSERPEEVIALLREEVKFYGFKEKTAQDIFNPNEVLKIPRLPLYETPLYEHSAEILAASVVIFADSEDGHGSGFFISKDGYILSNQHVVKDERYLKIRLVSGREVPAEVLRTDANRDVALLKVNETQCPALPLQLNEPSIGKSIYPLGAPLAQSYSSTLMKGVVSKYSSRAGDNGEEYKIIQHDASTHPGNSGCAVLDEFGNVVSIHVAGHRINGISGLGLGQSIPIASALECLSLRLQSPEDL